MKFSTRHDIEAPVEVVFEDATDFARFERQARRRGVDVKRLDRLAQIGIGMRWAIQFPYRGKQRRLHAELAHIHGPEEVNLISASNGIDTQLHLELLALSQNRTRLKIGLELKPRSLQARLLIQSLKFAKGNLDRKFIERVASFGRDVELRHNPARAFSR